jgi:hypothetical protein
VASRNAPDCIEGAGLVTRSAPPAGFFGGRTSDHGRPDPINFTTLSA